MYDTIMHKESSTSNSVINKEFSFTDFFLADFFQEKPSNFSCSGPSGAEESSVCGDPCGAAEEFACDNLHGVIYGDFHIAEKSFVHSNLCGTEESFISGDFYGAEESSFCGDHCSTSYSIIH